MISESAKVDRIGYLIILMRKLRILSTSIVLA